MLIDWFTVGAQLLNFVVLVFLLKFFLYKPVLQAIDTRELALARGLEAAEAQRAAGEAQAAEFQKKSEEMEHLRDPLFQAAREAARLEAQRLQEAEQEASVVRAAQRDAEFEAQSLLLQDSLADRVRTEVFSISRKILRELTDTSLEVRVAETLIAKLNRGLPDPSGSLAGFRGEGRLVVGTSSALSPDQELSLRVALERAVGAADVEFVTKPDLLGGMDLMAQGFRVVWSLEEALKGLETRILRP